MGRIGVCVTLLKGISRLPQQKGGRGRGGVGSTSPFRADLTLSPTWRIYNIVTLWLKYTDLLIPSERSECIAQDKRATVSYTRIRSGCSEGMY